MASKNGVSSEKETNVLSGKEEVVHNINIGNMILNAFKSRPDFIGQIDAATGEQTTFRQMRENSVKCALWLQKSRYESAIVSICTRNQMLAYIPLLASLYTGVLINPWDVNYFENHVRVMYFLVEYEPEIIFIDSSDYKELIRAIKVLVAKDAITPPKIITFDKVEGVDSLESILMNTDFDEAEIDQFSCDKTIPMNIMAVMYSTNATSYPGKANVRYFALTFPSNQEVPAMSSGDVGLWYGSLVWTYSLILTVRSIVSYVTVIKSSNFNVEDMYDTIEKYKVKWVFLKSEMCNQLFQIDIRMYNISSLKQLIFGDSAIGQNIYEGLSKYFINASIIQVYSIPDASIIATYQRDNDPIAASGYSAKNIELMIVNVQTKKILGPNKLGEIWYRYICEWCTAKTCKSPFCCNYQVKKNNINTTYTSAAITSTWHCTGDYGYYEKDGKLIIVDKIKRLIKYKEFHISPLRIEKVLQCHPAVAEVIVLSVPDTDNGQVPRAYIKIKHGKKVTREELEQLVAKNLPDIYKLRGGMHFVTFMPQLPNGKINQTLVHLKAENCLKNSPLKEICIQQFWNKVELNSIEIAKLFNCLQYQKVPLYDISR